MYRLVFTVLFAGICFWGGIEAKAESASGSKPAPNYADLFKEIRPLAEKVTSQ